MAQMLLQTIEQIGREKNIAPEVIVEAVEEAMAVASKKYYKTDETLEAKLNRDTGEVELYAVKAVVETVEYPADEVTLERAREHVPEAEVGDEVRMPRPVGDLGRIAAQAAKQVIYQKVRDAERENIYKEYEDRVGELITGIVKRFERGDMIIDLGRTEAILPRREQSRAEHYNIGDRIRVVIIDVLRATRGPQIVVSRTSPELLLRLFEMEVPEIYDGTVVIKAAVREGGDRAKVAVHSTEPDVDPVGACVGMRGSRVQAIIRELRGEKIDIVQWSPERQQFAINALKPARVNRVSVVEEEPGRPPQAEIAGELAPSPEPEPEPEAEPGEEAEAEEETAEEEIVEADAAEEVAALDEEEAEEPEEEQPMRTRLEVVVDEDQLSLAIGKKGQNVRLAGKLLGCKIDITSEEEKREEAERELTRMMRREANLEAIPGVGPTTAEALVEAGYASLEQLCDAAADDLTEVPGIGAKTAEKILGSARELLAEQEAEEAAAEAEEAAVEADDAAGEAEEDAAEEETVASEAEDVEPEGEPEREPELA